MGLDVISYSKAKKNEEDLDTLGAEMDEKVNKEENKGLSTNDFTNELKQKVETIPQMKTKIDKNTQDLATHKEKYEDKFPSNSGSHNSIYRGKYLGDTPTAKQYADIANGSFEDMYIGDYWTINGMDYIIAAFNYFLGTGDANSTTNHVTLVTRGNMYNSKMNSSNITTGGYAGSEMYTSGLERAKTMIKAAFPGHVLKRRSLLCNATSGGKASGWAWFDSEVDLMNEFMVYGGSVFGAGSLSGGTGHNIGVEKTQLPLFTFRPDLIGIRYSYWLRDVVTAAYFAYVLTYSYANYSNASYSLAVRPYFSIS